MEFNIKVVGSMTEEELKKASTSRPEPLSANQKRLRRERNILLSIALKNEADRYKSHRALVEEWSKMHTRYSTQVQYVKDAVDELHKKSVEKLNEMPISEKERSAFVEDVEMSIAKMVDKIEDNMFDIEENEINASREEAIRFRKNRDDAAELARNEAKAKEAEALLKAQRKAEALRKHEEELKKAENEKRKKSALDADISDNTIVLNSAGVNKNLLSLSPKLANMIKRSNMTRVNLAQTKGGLLVIVCDKPVNSNGTHVSFNIRDGKTRGTITSNTICSYIRNKYDINDTDEYRFEVHYVAYADNIKIRINNLITND